MQSNKYLWLAVLAILLVIARFYYSRSGAASLRQNKQIIVGTIEAIDIGYDKSFTPTLGTRGLLWDQDPHLKGMQHVRISLKEYPDSVFEIDNYGTAARLGLVGNLSVRPGHEAQVGGTKITVGSTSKSQPAPQAIGSRIRIEGAEKSYLEPDPRITNRGVSLVKINPKNGKHLYHVTSAQMVSSGTAAPARPVK